MIFSLKRGDAVAASVKGAPPALFTSTSRRPCCATTAATSLSTLSGSRTSHATNEAVRPPALGRRVRRLATTHHDGSASRQERSAMPRPSALRCRP
jgi:hypothetical protein